MENAGLEHLRRAAAAWVVRLNDPSCTDADRAEFEAWRAHSPSHEAAYQRELAAWTAFDRLKVLAAGRRAVDPDLIPAKPRKKPSWPIFRLAAGFGGAVLLAGAAVFMAAAPPAYATGLGERRVVVLDDGTQIELNTQTKILVRSGLLRRKAVLVNGEALFRASGKGRPIEISAGAARFVVSQAEVDVRRMDDAVVARVRTGRIAIAAPRVERAAEVVTAGRQVEVDANVVKLSELPGLELDRLLAWRNGAVVFDGQTLQDAVAEFNRYNRQKLVVADDSIRSLRIGGYFRTDDPGRFVAAVTRAFPVKAEAVGDQLRLEPRS